MYVWEHKYAGTNSQMMASNPLELEFRTLGSCLLRVLGIPVGSLGKAAVFLSAKPSLSPSILPLPSFPDTLCSSGDVYPLRLGCYQPILLFLLHLGSDFSYSWSVVLLDMESFFPTLETQSAYFWLPWVPGRFAACRPVCSVTNMLASLELLNFPLSLGL